jgi:hypothetical protein
MDIQTIKAIIAIIAGGTILTNSGLPMTTTNLAWQQEESYF